MNAVTYAYKVRGRAGGVVTGEVQGTSTAAVAASLRERGMIPLSIREKKVSRLQKEIKIPGLGGKVKPKQIAVFSRQFATMVNSGLSLIRTLNILEQQTENKSLARAVGKVRADVERGASLSQSLEKHPKIFSHLYVAMVKAGEIGGVLDETLLRVADMLEAQAKLRSKVKSAMTYPVVVLGLVILIVFAMLIFVVPMFEEMYAELGGNLPKPTQVLLGMADLVGKFWYIVAGLTLGGLYSLKRWITTEKGRAAFDAFKLRLPVFGMLVHKAALSRFARSLSVLSRSGVPILQAIDIVGDTSGNHSLKVALRDVRDSVKQGEAIADPLRHHKIFPPMVVQMMAVGEETGALDEMLSKVSDFYDREVDDAVNALTSLIEPLLIIILGVTVGGMLVALYLPMFNIANLIQ